ncbi:MAG TPA: phosphotransferase [Mycobacteriales bacterium]|nr:phosphotransferase [Mycobacteriales bacterium]
MTTAASHSVAEQLARFLVGLHSLDPVELTSDLPNVRPRAQADTTALRARFPVLVDEHRGALVLHWCDWVDEVLGGEAPPGSAVVVHGDLHGYNQVWDRPSATLRAVVDFEETGVEDFHFDLRYLPGLVTPVNLAMAVANAYSRLSGRSLSIERMMAWNVLTVLGDAMWRTEAGVELPGGGTAADWVDDLQARLAASGLE